ncbi:Hypothetical predicted protein [Mytilus galloprovincialis]|nr:Hypothetical predicted protein [Mytilus galloprovincialis]
MALNVDVEKQFLRLFMFSHKISLPVVRTFFVSNVLGKSNYNNDIITFLEHHKHELFHLVGDYKCCQCTNLPSLQTRFSTYRLGNNQFKKLYDVGLSTPGHFSKGSGGRVFQQCLCCITVRKETNPKTYDISLLITILYNCVQLLDNIRLWLDTIRKCRNRLCHTNDINEFSQSEIQTLWGNLEFSVLMLAAEVTAQPDYKESIETQVDILKYADYSRDVVTPIMDAMKLEINNNINGIKQEQIVLHGAMKCLTTNVKKLALDCKEDNKKMSEHVSASTTAVLTKQQDAFNNLSDKVAQCHIKDAEHQKKVSETLEHTIQKLNFVVEIVNKSQSLGTDKSLQENDTGKKNRPSEEKKSADDNGKTTSTTEEQKSDDDSVPYKVRWTIETPGHLQHKKDDIVKVLKKAIEIVRIGTSHKIEDVYEGSITIDTLLPMSILQDKEAFHDSIRKFLSAIVTICRIDTTIPLEVKVQITLIDQEKGSVQYSLGEMQYTTKISKAVSAIPTMSNTSTETIECDTIGSSDSQNWADNSE